MRALLEPVHERDQGFRLCAAGTKGDIAALGIPQLPPRLSKDIAIFESQAHPPGKGRDHYHTCYCLSGLSVAQHFGRDGVVGPPAANLLEKINPLVNVVESSYVRWMSAVEKRTRT